MNNRRKLLIALGAGTLTLPLACFAQQASKVWRVGFLSPRSRPISFDSDLYNKAFSKGMRGLGYIEGKNFVIEWRFADGSAEHLQGLADELVQLKVDVIVAENTTATRAAQKSTATIPIVMGTSADPVGSGFVKSLARPGSNITGLTTISADISPKLLEMLHSMVPTLSRVAVLVNPSNPGHPTVLKNVETAAQRTGVTILSLEARTPQEIQNAFSVIAQKKAGAVILLRDSLFNQQVRELAALAAKYRMPAIHGVREFVESGGLMSYGSSLTDNFRRAATYVDKIFKGAKPGDLPVEQPTKFELFINRKTAKALGRTIPQSLLVSADKVIE